jgi:hypothetical protein
MKRRRTKRIDRGAGLVQIKLAHRGQSASPRKSTKKITAPTKTVHAVKPRVTKNRGTTKKPAATRKRQAPTKSSTAKKVGRRKNAATRSPQNVVIRPAPRIDDRRIQVALFALREGKTAAAAAREAGMTPKALTNYLERTGIARWNGKHWVFSKKLAFEWSIPSNGQWQKVTIGSARASKGVSTFLTHVHYFSESNNPRDVGFFRGLFVTDIHGKRHSFETRPDVLRELLNTADPYEQIYRIVPPQ